MKYTLILTASLTLLTLGTRAASVGDAAKTAVEAINAVTEQGKTPLMLAAEDDNLDEVKKLLADGADVNAANENGVTALMCACETYGDSIIQTLIDAGANVNAKDQNGFTPLACAAANKALDTVNLLIASKADVNLQPPNREYTALMHAVYAGDADCIKALLAAKAEVNVICTGGYTPLLLACDRENAESALILLHAGANPRVESENGDTPASRAENSGEEELVNLLKQALAGEKLPDLPSPEPPAADEQQDDAEQEPDEFSEAE